MAILELIRRAVLSVKEKERRSSIVYRSKERENYKLIYERERRKTACRLPKPKPKAEYQYRALLLAMGAGEPGGGRRGRWGRPATGLMPESTSIEDSVSHRAKSLVNKQIS
jgi:hypothetical protein